MRTSSSLRTQVLMTTLLRMSARAHVDPGTLHDGHRQQVLALATRLPAAMGVEMNDVGDLQHG